MKKSVGASRPGAHVISLAQWKADHSRKSPLELEDRIFGLPSGLPPLDREYTLRKWMEAFEDYVTAYELCRLDRRQVAAAVEETAAVRGRSAEEQAGWLEMAALRLRRYADCLDDAFMKVEFVNSSLLNLA